MPVTHTNRKGEIYYLHQGQTRTGKPRYHFSKKRADNSPETIPDGYEIYENPNAQVFLRRPLTRLILPEEVAQVDAVIRTHAGITVFLLDVTEDAIEVYMPDRSRGDIENLVEKLTGFRAREKQVRDAQWSDTFSAMLRFVLRSREENRFSVQRWCFRGGIDGWTWDLAVGPLEALVKKYAPHLDKESFFELM